MVVLENSQNLKSPQAKMNSNHFSQLFYLENISVVYRNGFKALNSLCFTMRQDEIVFVTGASGAGKTSLLKVLAGELTPTSGHFDFKPPRNDYFTVQVTQQVELVKRKKCIDHLYQSYDKSIYKTEKAFEQEMNDLIRFFGIDNRLQLKVSEANGGLKQKVAIIRALLSRPDLFIADEPTSSLDTTNAQKLFEVLELYNRKRGMGVIWASHNRELVRQFSGRIVHLDKGCLVHSGHACFI